MSMSTFATEARFGASALLRDHDQTRLLLIAGNTHATETLAELLEALGYHVQTAATVYAAGKLRAPEVIIADACLPDGGASDVLRELRMLPGWDAAPAIMLGRLDPGQAVWSESAGFTESLPKPVSIWALHRAVQNALFAGSARGRSRW